MDKPTKENTTQKNGAELVVLAENRKELFLEELFKTLGCELSACQRTGVSREEYERWKREDPDFERRVAQIDDDALDYVESRMFEEIKSGNAQLIKFYLETKGRARGYGKEPRAAEGPNAPAVVLTQDEMAY